MYVQGHLAFPGPLSESPGGQNYFRNNTNMLFTFPQNFENACSRFSIKKAYLNHSDNTVVKSRRETVVTSLGGECFYLKPLSGLCNLQGRIRVAWAEERVPGPGRWVLGAEMCSCQVHMLSYTPALSPAQFLKV